MHGYTIPVFFWRSPMDYISLEENKIESSKDVFFTQEKPKTIPFARIEMPLLLGLVEKVKK